MFSHWKRSHLDGAGTDSARGSAWRELALAAIFVGTATALCFAVTPFLSLTNLAMIYLLATLATATRGRRGSAVFSAALGVLCFDFFFVPPRFTLRVSDLQYVVTFAVMFAAAMILSHLTVRLREEAEAAREGQERTEMTHALTEALTSALGLDGVLAAAVSHVEKMFGAQAFVLLPDEAGRLIAPTSGGPDEKSRAVAQWVFESGRPAGAGTDSLPEADVFTLPLRGGETSVGVLLVRGGALPAGRRLLLDSFAHAIALAVSAAVREEEVRRAELDAETERLRSSLLSSISHDFRTPLTAIVGSAEALLEKKTVRDDPAAADLADNIREEGERLSRLVGNLLEATRLESGAAHLRKELVPLEEVVEAALERVKKTLGRHEVSVNLPEDLPAVPLDAVLMEQVFINLLENASRHAPAGGGIELSAEAGEGSLSVSVRDRGPGIKPEELERVFEKFHRGASSPGAGLGLAICRAVVNAHGGRIWAGNRPGGGAEFRFTLPLEASSGR